MKQVWISRPGPPEVLELREAPDPEPGPGEVRVRVHAAGVNFADLVGRTGAYPDAPPIPYVPGYEIAGVIDAVGEGVDEALVGRRVCALTRFGGYATARCIPAREAIPVPDGADLVTAAGLLVTGVTAWMMLEEMGRVRAGDRVLVHSAGGGVGLVALDLLKWRGAVAVGTASAAKHPFLRQRGYDELVDYRTQDFEAVLAQGPGFDLILDPVGGRSWAKGLRLLRPGGRLVCFGASSMTRGTRRSLLAALRMLLGIPWLQVNPIALMNANKGVMGVNMARMFGEGDRVAGWVVRLLQLWQEGVIRPVVHARIPLERAAEAHRILHDRENLGKVILVTEHA